MRTTKENTRTPGGATFAPARVGFTLIELLVVVSIIAMLVSILIPSLARAREGARSAVCLSNLKQMASAVVMYTAEGKSSLPGPVHMCIYLDTGSYPDRTPTGGLVPGAQLQWGAQLPYYIQRYLGDSSRSAKGVDQLATCPSNDGALPIDKQTRDKKLRDKKLRVWHYALNTVVAASSQGGSSTYDIRNQTPYYRTSPPSYFGRISMNAARTSDLSSFAADYKPKNVETVKKTSQEWMVADGWYWESRYTRGRTWPSGTYPYFGNAAAADDLISVNVDGLVVPGYPFHNTTTRFDGNIDAPTRDLNPNSPRLTTGRTNASYFDGHAESVRKWKGTPNPTFAK